ncbi:MAG: sulfatase-like hydrolase/transferase [Chloroflexota bacterium]
MEQRPNIILFMTDQLRRDALGCYGNEICQTPNLDKLATQGACFENAFTTSPVCSPSRASLMTGLYPHNNGVMLNTHIAPAWNRGLSPDKQTFSAILKQAGYVTDYVGKWHVNQDIGPEEFGFDRYENPAGKRELISGTETAVNFADGTAHVVAATNGCAPDETSLVVKTRRGIEMMRERAQDDAPFFLRVDVTEPHHANIPPEPYASMYNPQDIPPWDNFPDDFTGKPDGHLRKSEEWGLVGKEWGWWREVVAKYYGDVTHIDTCVGEMLNEIEALGIADNTIFIFSTDHGDATGSHNHFEKGGTMYDEVYRIPLLVKGPSQWIIPGKIDSFVRLLDLMPTFVEWSGGQLATPIDGKSLSPLMLGETVSDWPDSVYCESHGEVWGYFSQRMVRTKRWKYVYAAHTKDELYDLQVDPAELNNLIDDPAFVDVLSEMKARLLGWNDATNDMFQWRWVRQNFPEPLAPDGANAQNAPLTA